MRKRPPPCSTKLRDHTLVHGGWVVGHGHATLCVPITGTSITFPVPECGHVDPANRASRLVFACVVCGYQAHADINAAIIVRGWGIKLALVGRSPVSALRGNYLESDLSGAEPEYQGRRGSGNQESGCITVRVVEWLRRGHRRQRFRTPRLLAEATEALHFGRS